MAQHVQSYITLINSWRSTYQLSAYLTEYYSFTPSSRIPTLTIAVASELHKSADLNQSLDLGHGRLNGSIDVGTMVIEYCGDIHPRIHETIDGIKWLALVSLSNARLYGVDSDFGFQTMFKEDFAVEPVVTILDHIYHFKGKTNLRPYPDALSSPRLSCLTKETARFYRFLHLDYDLWHRCLVGGPRATPLQAFYAEGTVYTFLCPAFFVQPPTSVRYQCPTVSDNTFSGDPGIFYRNYQTYIILYQLIRFYLGDNALNYDTDPIEQLDWNACIGLGAVDSVLNPTNLQIYIARKLYESRVSFYKYRLNRVD